MSTGLDKLVEFAKDASKAVVQSGQEHVPMLIVRAGEELTIVVVEVPKAVFRDAAIHLLRKLRADAYVLVNEGWRSNVAKDSPIVQDLVDGKVTVSQLHPDDRDEVLLVTAVENGGDIVCWNAMIEVDWLNDEECVRRLCPWERMGDIVTGRMVIERW